MHELDQDYVITVTTAGGKIKSTWLTKACCETEAIETFRDMVSRDLARFGDSDEWHPLTTDIVSSERLEFEDSCVQL